MPVEPERKEEAQLMAVRTVIFGTGFAGDMRLGYVFNMFGYYAEILMLWDSISVTSINRLCSRIFYFLWLLIL